MVVRIWPLVNVLLRFIALITSLFIMWTLVIIEEIKSFNEGSNIIAHIKLFPITYSDTYLHPPTFTKSIQSETQVNISPWKNNGNFFEGFAKLIYNFYLHFKKTYIFLAIFDNLIKSCITSFTKLFAQWTSWLLWYSKFYFREYAFIYLFIHFFIHFNPHLKTWLLIFTESERGREEKRE